MADKGIIFSGPMVRALLEGRKSQTRRLLSGAPKLGEWFCDRTATGLRWVAAPGSPSMPCVLPYTPGDRLYVREAWKATSLYDRTAPRDLSPTTPIYFVADDRLWPVARYRQGMHMPRWASRLWLNATDVRVQRVQDISEADAIAEGCVAEKFPGPWWQGYRDAGGGDLIHQQAVGETPPDWMIEPKRMKDMSGLDRSARDRFASLWNSLHTKPGERWEDDPWVVAVSFTVNRGNIDEAHT